MSINASQLVVVLAVSSPTVLVMPGSVYSWCVANNRLHGIRLPRE